MTVEQRFLAKVNKTATCWLWRAARNHGYGYFSIGGRSGGMRHAHRIAYELWVGPIPAGLDVLHRCDNPPCVNPAHLYLGTDVENAGDRHRRDRDARGSRNGRAKLTAAAVAEIRLRCSTGTPQRVLAAEFGIDPSNVSHIVRGKTWRGGGAASTAPG